MTRLKGYSEYAEPTRIREGNRFRARSDNHRYARGGRSGEDRRGSADGSGSETPGGVVFVQRCDQDEQ